MSRRGENIYKRADGRYEGRYIKGYNINGKAVYGYVYARRYSDVKEKLARCKSDIAPKSSGSATLLSDWLDIWIKTAAVKESTRELYLRHIQNHIVPQIGDLPLKKLSTELIQRFVSGLELAPSTVRLVFTILKSALMCAEDKGFITNVWSKIKLPKQAKSEVQIFTLQEQQQLENALSEENDIGILICLYTGLRIGEVCALKWSDVDFESKLIHIRGTQARLNGKLTITEPKSKASKRTIPIPDILFDRLKKHKNSSEFVLSNKGGMVEVRAYRRRFKAILKTARLPDIKFHALRHTFSTRALEVGMDYKTLSEFLGHASVAITMDLYVHALDEHKKNQINKLNEIYGLPSN